MTTKWKVGIRIIRSDETRTVFNTTVEGTVLEAAIKGSEKAAELRDKPENKSADVFCIFPDFDDELKELAAQFTAPAT